MKITIVGAGNVGATCAMRILEAGLGDIVLIDIVESIAKGKAEDLMDAASLLEHGCSIEGTSDYRATAGSDIVVITAGFARTPGMTREELLKKNTAIVSDVARSIAAHSKDPVIIVVTNPLDIMAYLVYKETGLSHKKVIGMAGLLDSSRMNLMVSRLSDIGLNEADSLVLGTHGETMVPVITHSKAGGKPLSEQLPHEKLDEVVEKTKARGAEIVSYFGKGSAYYAPSAGVFRMVKAVVNDTKEVLACSCMLTGEYGGIDGIYLGVPARLGRDGVEKVMEVALSEEEKSLLKKAADSVRKQIAELVL